MPSGWFTYSEPADHVSGDFDPPLWAASIPGLAQIGGGDPDRETSRRPTLYGGRHAVSAGHYLAAAAGFAILEAGGNAIDAGCAAGLALTVLFPDEVNFAGVAPMMIRAGGRLITIAGLGKWPGSIPPDIFMREYGGVMPCGVLRTVVPAAPAAWITALRDFGTLSFGDVASAAIRYAREGFSVSSRLAAQIAELESDYRRWSSNSEVFLPAGRPPRAGERFVQTDLANTLQNMADAEAAASVRGRDTGLEGAHRAFYRGDIARQIVGLHEQDGGHLTLEDLAGFRSEYEPPVRVRWRDFEVFTCGPWCQGPVLAQCLRMLSGTSLSGVPHNSTEYAHLVLEVMKIAFADREYRYGDPRMVDVGVDELLSDTYVQQRLSAIDPTRACAGMPPPIGRDFPDYLLPRSEPAATPTRNADTSYVCVSDRWGNVFSAVPSDGSANSPVVPGLGIVPSDRGCQSRPDPRHPSGVAPGKRPRLTPNPAMAIRDDGSVFVWGCPGGDMQVQAMLQVFLNVFHFGMDLQEAINAPRFSTWSFPNSFAPFTYLPGRVAIEARLASRIGPQLEARGHEVERWPDFTRTAGAVEAILREPHTSFVRAAADPRQDAYAIVS